MVKKERERREKKNVASQIEKETRSIFFSVIQMGMRLNNGE